MEENQGYELEISERTGELLEKYAAKTGKSMEEAFEYVAVEYVQNQLPHLVDKSKESGVSINELLDQHFARALEFLLERTE